MEKSTLLGVMRVVWGVRERQMAVRVREHHMEMVLGAEWCDVLPLAPVQFVNESEVGEVGSRLSNTVSRGSWHAAAGTRYSSIRHAPAASTGRPYNVEVI